MQSHDRVVGVRSNHPRLFTDSLTPLQGKLLLAAIVTAILLALATAMSWEMEQPPHLGASSF
jgi:hypothetical protein